MHMCYYTNYSSLEDVRTKIKEPFFNKLHNPLQVVYEEKKDKTNV